MFNLDIIRFNLGAFLKTIGKRLLISKYSRIFERGILIGYKTLVPILLFVIITSYDF